MRPNPAHRKSAFALVLAILLVALLATSGVGLALTAMGESTIAEWSVHELDHQLAVDSAVRMLPRLLATETSSRRTQITGDKMRMSLSVGSIGVTLWAQPEGSKLRAGGTLNDSTLMEQLNRIALDEGWPVDNILLHPLLSDLKDLKLPRFVCLDQLVRPTGLEEMYVRPDSSVDRSRQHLVAWSDRVTFWSSAVGRVYALNIKSQSGSDNRWWYAVVAIGSGDPRILYLERV